MAKSASRDELAKRIRRLEKQLERLIEQQDGVSRKPERQAYCSVPQLPERKLGPNVSAQRARLIRYGARKWVNGTVLHYYFFEEPPWRGGEEQKKIVREAFSIWEDVGIGLPFKEVSSPDDAEIRIGFQRRDGYWSYVGTDVLEIGQQERTMNFGYDLTQDSRGVDVPVHEIGHTLGFPHEHQNPFAGIVWDEEAVYRHFGGSPNNWDRETTYHNVLRKIPQSRVEGSEWDPDSIMHYEFAPGLIEEPEEYQDGLSPAGGLSQTDIEQVRFFYPPLSPTHPQLRPFELERLSLAPGEQKDFTIKPTSTRRYTIQTFGATDAVMVLFERTNGEPQYIDGDDDSGWDRNARIRERLYAGHEYVLRIRLYYQWDSGETAVMLW